MKKLIKNLFVLCLTLVTVLAVAGCSKNKKENTIVVGASATPHAEILELVKDDMKAKGYTLEIKVFADYVQPNLQTESGDIDANYFQHIPYLNDFNKENKTHLVNAGGIHYEPFGIYAGKKTNLDVKTGLTISIPNDGTNEARALLLLEQEGFIELNENVGLTATVLDIKDTKGNTINELEAAAISRTRADVDLVVLNGNYALQAELKVSDALAIEAADSLAADTYVNILCVKSGNEDKAIVKALYECLTSQKVKDYILRTYEGSVVPKF